MVKGMARRGFTLVEMSAVIAVLMLLAALAMPSLVSRLTTREVTRFFVAAPDLAVFARERAQRDRLTVRVIYDEARQALLAETVPDANDPQAEEGRELSQVAVPESVRATNFRVEDDSVPTGDWALTFYPDGRSDGGGIEFDDNGRIRHIVVTPDGTTRIGDGPLPTTDERRWPAGEIEQRI